MIKHLLESEIYEYKGNHYKVVDLVKMKNPISRDWVVAVIYQKHLPSTKRELENNEERKSPRYCRIYDEFVKLFKAIL